MNKGFTLIETITVSLFMMIVSLIITYMTTILLNLKNKTTEYVFADNDVLIMVDYLEEIIENYDGSTLVVKNNQIIFNDKKVFYFDSNYAFGLLENGREIKCQIPYKCELIIVNSNLLKLRIDLNYMIQEKFYYVGGILSEN